MSNYNAHNGGSRNGNSRFRYAGLNVDIPPVSTSGSVDSNHGAGHGDSVFFDDPENHAPQQPRQIIDLDTRRTRSVPNTWGGGNSKGA
jgi:hypothetical protein